MNQRRYCAKARSLPGSNALYSSSTVSNEQESLHRYSDWKKDIVDVKRMGDRIISIKFVVERGIFHVISTYAPQVGSDEQHKIRFWKDLESLVQDIPSEDKIFLGGDLNGHVGREVYGYESIHGGHGFGAINVNGKTILDFSSTFDLLIADTCFKKRDEHLITYKSGMTSSQIDFFLLRIVN
uniref:Putative endonuclease/exonuclease/phosphatase n=1 Tax=Arachis hypogaea TaxID=3818 RepID=C0L2U5_ARAHY|nr:putative endonuclease/exonuclease/phosphatase [Arachis hypogaea]